MNVLISIYRIAILSGITALATLYANSATANPVLLQAFSDCENWVSESENPNFQIQLNKLLQKDRSSGLATTYASPIISIVLKTNVLETTVENRKVTVRSCNIEAVDVSRGNYRERLRAYDVGSTWDSVEVLSLPEVRETLNSISGSLAQSPNYVSNNSDEISNHGENTSFFWCGPHWRFVQILPDGVLPIKEGEFHRWSIHITQHSNPPQHNSIVDCPSS